MLVMAPVAVGRATIVTVAVSAFARLPMLQLTLPPLWLQLPRLGVAETKVAPAGRVSVSKTLRAAFGPRLVIVTE